MKGLHYDVLTIDELKTGGNMLKINEGYKKVERISISYPKIEAFIKQETYINTDLYVLRGCGKATCDSGDMFDKNFGIKLAKIRAEINMLKDYEKLLISLTKQPEWRKEIPKKENPKEEYIIAPSRSHFVENHINIFNNHIDNKKIKVTVEVL